MKLNYYKDTDSLYIDLSGEATADSKEIDEDVVIDYNDAGLVVGIDIQHASKRIDLSTVVTEHLPMEQRPNA